MRALILKLPYGARLFIALPFLALATFWEAARRRVWAGGIYRANRRREAARGINR